MDGPRLGGRRSRSPLLALAVSLPLQRAGLAGSVLCLAGLRAGRLRAASWMVRWCVRAPALSASKLALLLWRVAAPSLACACCRLGRWPGGIHRLMTKCRDD